MQMGILRELDKNKRVRSERKMGRINGQVEWGDFDTLHRSTDKFNTEIDARTIEGRKLIAGLTAAEKKGKIGSLSESDDMLDRLSPGMAQSTQDYVSITKSLSQISGTNAESAQNRANLEMAKNQLILKGRFPEAVYQDAAKYRDGLEKRLTYQANDKDPARTFTINGQPVDLKDGNWVPRRRHAGGLSSGETVIQAGRSPEFVVPGNAADTFRTAVPQLQEIMSRMLNEGGDTMSTDAQQYQSTFNVSVSGNVRHEGTVLLAVNDDVRSLLEKLTEMVQPEGGKTPRKGQKLYSPLVER